MKIFKNLENGSVVEGLLMDVVPNGYRELKALFILYICRRIVMSKERN